MTSRLLPIEEWPKLAATEARTVWSSFPEQTRVVVVEDAGQIVGCHVLVAVLHAECLWIHPAHRGKTSVARRLWAAVKREARETFGASWLMTGALTDDVRELLEHVGAVKVDMDHYMIPLENR